MNKLTVAVVGAVLLAAAPGTLFAQFSSGSTGAYGAINITADTTLTVPPDGVFHATTVTVADNVVLRFVKNELNTPVYILATGDVKINGSINLDGEGYQSGRGGRGGPGGFDGGSPSINGAAPGAGFGPGAGLPGIGGQCTGDGGGGGSFATAGGGRKSGFTVWNQLDGPPGRRGSGGGGSTNNGGAGGGGAILIASSTKIIMSECDLIGDIVARGGDGGCYTGDGSGGAIRLVAPKVTGCSGGLHVGGESHGGTGRIRIDTTDRSGISGIGFNPGQAAVIGSFMKVFPTTMPKLDITNVAGNAIAKGTQTAVSLLLPTGSSTTQPVTVEATNFVGTVPVRIVVTPETGGSPVNFDTTITIATGATTGSVTTNVTIPVNTPVKIHAWTR